MMHSLKLMLSVAILAGVATAPTLSQAENTTSKATSASTQKQAANDEFEENRKAHSQKSKENNTNKGAN